MNAHQGLTDEQNQMRINGLRILARIIARHLVTESTQGVGAASTAEQAHSAEDGARSDEMRSAVGGAP